jgi:hypothetical protein
MNRVLRTGLALLVPAVIALNASVAIAADPGITLIGKGTVDGHATDKSGLTGDICQASDAANCVPAAIFGGYGSDIAYTGHDNVFVAAPDRGPFDGLTGVPYVDRFHFLHITTEVGAAFPNIHTTLLDTRFLRDVDGTRFVGSAGDFERRFDPEGIRVAPDGTFYVSDEYGPYILQFDRQGNLLRRVEVPADFAIANPSANPTEELLGNTSGRQANRGMEGLAISPDGGTLFGIMQNALLQDNALVPGTTDRQSFYTRILKVDLATGHTAEYVYPLVAANRGQGISEILAINSHEFLVLERDNRSYLASPPSEPTRKTVYRIDIAGATDVSDTTLPATGALPVGVTAVTKSVFIDLLAPAFGLKAGIAEKLEGLAWGQDLADGRHLLYVVSDNDLNPAQDTQLYAFAVTDAVADVQHQVLPGPLFPPGLVKKLTR